jgi:hypothetical protein
MNYLNFTCALVCAHYARAWNRRICTLLDGFVPKLVDILYGSQEVAWATWFVHAHLCVRTMSICALCGVHVCIFIFWDGFAPNLVKTFISCRFNMYNISPHPNYVCRVVRARVCVLVVFRARQHQLSVTMLCLCYISFPKIASSGNQYLCPSLSTGHTNWGTTFGESLPAQICHYALVLSMIVAFQWTFKQTQ